MVSDARRDPTSVLLPWQQESLLHARGEVLSDVEIAYLVTRQRQILSPSTGSFEFVAAIVSRRGCHAYGSKN
jgi:hypothetical protein